MVEGLELDPGDYNRIVIKLTAEDLNNSHVLESDDTVHTLVTATDGLELSGIALSSGEEAYTIEFDLAQSLQAVGDGYLLTSNGVRVVDSTRSAVLSGTVDEQLFDGVAPCDAKADPEKGNRVYLYEGTGLDAGSLGDVFTSSDETADVIAPFSVGTIVKSGSTSIWGYVFGFLPAGDYTIAFSCDAEEDDPEDFDGLSIPFPTGHLYEVTLSNSDNWICNIEEESPGEC